MTRKSVSSFFMSFSFSLYGFPPYAFFLYVFFLPSLSSSRRYGLDVKVPLRYKAMP